MLSPQAVSSPANVALCAKIIELAKPAASTVAAWSSTSSRMRLDKLAVKSAAKKLCAQAAWQRNPVLQKKRPPLQSNHGEFSPLARFAFTLETST